MSNGKETKGMRVGVERDWARRQRVEWKGLRQKAKGRVGRA